MINIQKMSPVQTRAHFLYSVIHKINKPHLTMAEAPFGGFCQQDNQAKPYNNLLF